MRKTKRTRKAIDGTTVRVTVVMPEMDCEKIKKAAAVARLGVSRLMLESTLEAIR